MLTLGKTTSPAHRRYVVRTLAFMSGYTAAMVAVIFGAFDALQNTSAAWLLAAAVTAPIVGQIWATLSMMREADEFVRALTAKQFIISAGIAMAALTFWGFGESFAGAPHVEGWVIYPLFWGVYGLVSPFVRSSR